MMCRMERPTWERDLERAEKKAGKVIDKKGEKEEERPRKQFVLLILLYDIYSL